MCNILHNYETLYFAHIHFTNVLFMVLTIYIHALNTLDGEQI